MEQIAAPLNTIPRRSLNRKLANLPPIATGLPERPITSMNEKQEENSPSSSSTGSSCQNMLPCIMITPSSPIHEYDYEIHYFDAPEAQGSSSRCRGFFASIRQAFCPSSTTSCTSSSSPAIALPDSPSVPKYGYHNTSSSDRTWSASRRFRMILALAAVLFFALHLIAIPKMQNGMYEVFSTHHSYDGSAQMMDDGVASWETVSEWQPAPPASAHHDAVGGGHPHHAKPVGVAEPAHPAL